MSATQLHKLLSTLMQIIQSEICKQTAAALEAKLTAESLGSLLSQLSRQQPATVLLPLGLGL
jgi:hypothetical protein